MAWSNTSFPPKYAPAQATMAAVTESATTPGGVEALEL